MDIISTLADILLSHPKRKKVPTENPTPSTSSQTVETKTSSEASSLSPKSAQEPKPKSRLNLERILSILQTTQKGGQEPPPRSSGSPDEPQPSTSSPASSTPAAADPLSSLLTKDAIRILMPTLQEVNTKFNVEKQLAALNATAAAAKLMPKTLPPCSDTTEEDELEEEFEEEEEQIEYKFAPRPVFLATNCQVSRGDELPAVQALQNPSLAGMQEPTAEHRAVRNLPYGIVLQRRSSTIGPWATQRPLRCHRRTCHSKRYATAHTRIFDRSPAFLPFQVVTSTTWPTS